MNKTINALSDSSERNGGVITTVNRLDSLHLPRPLTTTYPSATSSSGLDNLPLLKTPTRNQSPCYRTCSLRWCYMHHAMRDFPRSKTSIAGRIYVKTYRTLLHSPRDFCSRVSIFKGSDITLFNWFQIRQEATTVRPANLNQRHWDSTAKSAAKLAKHVAGVKLSSTDLFVKVTIRSRARHSMIDYQQHLGVDG